MLQRAAWASANRPSVTEYGHPGSLVLSCAGLAYCFTHPTATADRIVAAVTA